MKQNQPFYKYDAVSFELDNETQRGWVAELRGKYATVEVEDHAEYRILQARLKRRPWSHRRPAHTEKEYLQFVYLPKDEVEFSNGGDVLRGSISNLANKRASVTLAGGETWKVPYRLIRLHHSHETTIRDRKRKLADLAERALEELRKHDLNDWIFRFDASFSRSGVCKHTHKMIAISNIHCLTHHTESIWDTVLHEIAHALVDPKVGHGPEWVKMAKAIGCTAKVRADEAVVRTRYIQTCLTCNWGRRLQRRVRNRRCARCGSSVEHLPYTDEAWQKIRNHPIGK